MDRFDALICGGGPAGACAAWKLAAGGARCLVLEGHPSRRKVCGGALSARAKEMLTGSGMLSTDDILSLSLREQDSMACCHGFEQLRLYRSPSGTVTMIDRGDLDGLLLQKAVSAGAELLAGDPVESACRSGAGVRTRSGRVFEARMTIAADGAAGPVGMSFRTRRRRHPRGMGMEYFIPMTRGFPGHIQIHFGLVPYGYAWVFPRRSDACVGIGCLGGGRSAPELLACLDGLVDRLGLEHPVPRIPEAAPIPVGPPDGNLGSGRVILAGDAAGLVDQLTGEGLSHAVESGLLAAGAMLGGWDRRRLVDVAGRGCLRVVRQSRLARHLVFHPALRDRAMRGLREKDKFFAGYWKLISGTSDYRSMLVEFVRNS